MQNMCKLYLKNRRGVEDSLGRKLAQVINAFYFGLIVMESIKKIAI